MEKVTDIFGSMVFDDLTMKANLSSETYIKLKKTIDEGAPLDLSVANVVAEAMKDWAIEKGATHFTHWFQPLTGVTAEKHDSFISPSSDGRVVMEFSGKELIKGEPDASSFPSGGIRATFEARGYTAWDPTSYAFVKGKTLYIPTAFCSYNGEALDKKTPLLRSMEALNREALRILRLFGNEDAKYVKTSVGAEQEYFLVDRELYGKRKDLVFTGRTLFGAMPPKGQEMDDHYFGALNPRVAAYMEDLDRELWKLGITAKTKHNEVAPGQHELAPIYTSTNIATDHNQLMMDVMQKVAEKHDLVCLLHEKPYEGVNGSGKHNNWSIKTDTGKNLFDPGETPRENAQFLIFLCAVIKAVDDYQDLLRIAVATAGNDCRLGANEAPPAVVSMFLGDELTAVMDAIIEEKDYKAAEKQIMKLGAEVLPKFVKDNTDRNRTSPFAFTGNKFEFRMVGSSDSIACTNIMLNSAVAESLRIYADRLEKADNFEEAVHKLIQKTFTDHRRIIFNGNGYDDEWIREAEERGLCNYRTTPDALPHLLDDKNVKMLTEQKVYVRVELESRCAILLENYRKTVMIEARTMTDMVDKQILPAVEGFLGDIAETVNAKRQFKPDLACRYESRLIEKLSGIADEIDRLNLELEDLTAKASGIEEDLEACYYIRDNILPKMKELRAVCDEAETMTAEEYWPIPNYGYLLFLV